MIKIYYQQAATWSARARVPIAVLWHYQDAHVQRALPFAALQCQPRARVPRVPTHSAPFATNRQVREYRFRDAVAIPAMHLCVRVFSSFL